MLGLTEIIVLGLVFGGLILLAGLVVCGIILLTGRTSGSAVAGRAHQNEPRS